MIFLRSLAAAAQEFGRPGEGAAQAARWADERQRDQEAQERYDENLPTLREQIYEKNVLAPARAKSDLAQSVAETNEANLRADAMRRSAANPPTPTLDQQLDAAIARGDRADIDRLMDLRDRKAGAGKSDRTLSNPFEAYVYGTPEQKQTATTFLDAEAERKQKAEKPSEWEERYRLYKQDPDAYLAMTGGDRKAAAADQAHADRMLKYFQSRRAEVEKDLLLDDATKKQKLDELAELERPYLDAAKPQTPAASGGKPASERRGGAPGAGRRAGDKNAATLPASAAAKLKEGVNTTFGNGQVWTLQKGKPVQVHPGQAQ